MSCPADIVLVLDASSSRASPDDYNSAKIFLANLANSLPIGTSSHQSRVGMVLSQRRCVVPASTSSTLIFFLDWYTTVPATTNAIRDAPQTGGGRCIACGMQRATNDVFVAPGDRAGVTNVMVVLTDGRDTSDVITARADAVSKGINIFAIGVGTGVDIIQLRAVTGNPYRVYTADSYASLGWPVLESLLKQICEAANSPLLCPTTPCPTGYNCCLDGTCSPVICTEDM